MFASDDHTGIQRRFKAELVGGVDVLRSLHRPVAPLDPNDFGG